MHDFRLYEDSVISEINRKHKADSVLPNGFRYIYFENIDSTNKYAKEHAGELENAIIVAENQYAGVGKNSSHWWSFTMSIEYWRRLCCRLILSQLKQLCIRF